MKNLNTPIKYKGNVKVAFVRNGKIIKKIKINNSGTLDFFKLIVRTIAGEYTAIDEMPRYLNAYTKDNNKAIEIRVKCNDINWDYDETTAYAKFHFLIPFNYCKDGSNGVIHKLVLENKNGIRCATIDLDENSGIKPDGKSNISISWDMSIKGE